MNIKPGDLITCKDNTVYQVVETISNEYALVDLSTYEILFPYDIKTYINLTHEGIQKVYEHYTDYF